MHHQEIVIPKVWRSELPHLMAFVLFSVGCVIFTRMFPGTIITGRLFSLGDTTYMLSLPLLWFIPMIPLLHAMFRIYNVRYSIDERGLETRVGIISINQAITRIRFEDIRSIETEQSLMQRFLDVGRVEMGTAATGGVEMTFDGVSSPREIQEMLQRERDARLRLAQKQKPDAGLEQAKGVVGNE